MNHKLRFSLEGIYRQTSLLYPESTEGGRRVSVLKRPKSAPLNLG